MLHVIRALWLPAPSPAAVESYIALVAQARNPFFYTSLAVPDTLDGRFEMLLLHLWLLQHRLIQGAGPGDAAPLAVRESFSRDLSDRFFADMDQSLRELGVADTGMRRRIKAIAKAYHGRLLAYTQSLRDDEQLKSALARNLYGTVGQGDPALLTAMAQIVRRSVAALSAYRDAQLLAGDLRWPNPAVPPLNYAA